MKKIIVITLVFSLYSCSSSNTSISESQEWINKQNFTIEAPNEWRPVKHHGYVGYTPLNKGDNIYDNLTSVFEYKSIENPKFQEFVQSQIEKTNGALTIISQDIKNDKNHLGDIYIHKFESTWNGKVSKRHTVYFQQKGKYYYFSYASTKPKYEKYFDGAMSILKSFRLKN